MKRHGLALIGILFTVGSLFLAFRGIHFREVLVAIRDVNILWSIPIVGATLLSIWIRALRWKLMLEPIQRVKVGKAYSATMIGFMANNVLPMRLGELVRAYSIGRGTGISKSTAFATIVVERVFDLVALLLLLGLMMLRYPFQPWVSFSGYVALGVVVVMFTAMTFLRFRRAASLRIFQLLIRPLPDRLGDRLSSLLNRFLDGLEVLAKGHHLLYVSVLSIFTWLAMALSFTFTGLAFHLQLPLDGSLVMVVVCALAVMLPSGPGFVGTFELGAKSGLELFGVPETVALSYALFYHVVQFIPITLLGFYHLWRENFSLVKAVEEQGIEEDEEQP